MLAPAAHYNLGPGQTQPYGPGVLHSTAHPAKAWVIRVTGTDVDAIPRFRFKPSATGSSRRRNVSFRVERNRVPPVRPLARRCRVWPGNCFAKVHHGCARINAMFFLSEHDVKAALSGGCI